MKKLLICLCLLFHFQAPAQLGEAEQLLIDVDKLAQLKSILQNMYEGYQVLDKGYTTIKDISRGNFTLHKTFLDALLKVSPLVREYKRVIDIINYQSRLASQYRQAWKQFSSDASFTPNEIQYIKGVYQNLLQAASRNLDDLLTVLTPGALRMNDDERLSAIDRIYEESVNQFSFLRNFNNSTAILSLQRKNNQNEITRLGKLYLPVQ